MDGEQVAVTTGRFRGKRTSKALMSRIYANTSRPRARSVVSNSLQLYGLQPTRLLGPWDSPGTNTTAGCCFLLQGVFLAQGSNLHLLHWQVDSLPPSHQGRPTNVS